LRFARWPRRSIKALATKWCIGRYETPRHRAAELLQVDNPLINIFDELFIGLHSLDKAEMSSKALIKSSPDEKVEISAGWMAKSK